MNLNEPTRPVFNIPIICIYYLDTQLLVLTLFKSFTATADAIRASSSQLSQSRQDLHSFPKVIVETLCLSGAAKCWRIN